MVVIYLYFTTNVDKNQEIKWFCKIFAFSGKLKKIVRKAFVYQKQKK